jgi:nucleoside-diphosphate-sugar epimerase
MNQKVLLTGANGFIGKHAINPLSARGFEVHAISTKKGSHEAIPGLIWHQLDLMNKQDVEDLFMSFRFSYLLHFAWDTTPGKYWSSLENLAWVEASLHLVRSFISYGGKRVVVSGTCAEYDWKYERCDENQTPFLPATLYGSSKRGLYLILKSYCELMNVSFAWGYIFFLYGPNENPKRFVPSVIRGLLGKQSVPCSEGLQIRDFMHVRDVADAFASLLQSQVSGGVNIASGQGVSLREIAQVIAEITGGSERLLFGAFPTPANEPKQLLPTVRRLREELGWIPKIKLREGIEEAVLWWKQIP